jgi:hypothetical protein
VLAPANKVITHSGELSGRYGFAPIARQFVGLNALLRQVIRDSRCRDGQVGGWIVFVEVHKILQ